MDAVTGARILGAVEELSLEDILDGLRGSIGSRVYGQDSASRNIFKPTHFKNLDEIAIRHFRDTRGTLLSISGRSLPLVYQVASTLASPPHQAVLLIVDTENRFDATRLTCLEEDASHIYVLQPSTTTTFTPEHLGALITQAQDAILYGSVTSPERSGSRCWWGTIVLGGQKAGEIVTGWRGWLTVDRQQIRVFPLGISAEEAIEQRDARQQVVDSTEWEATSEWGGFAFHEGV